MHAAMRGDTTLERIVRAFAEAAAEHDFGAAEGWFATARLHIGRGEVRASAGPGRRAAHGLRGRAEGRHKT